MLSLTQNNKIAIAAISIFVLSFSAMLIFMGNEGTSPDYLKSDVLEAAMGSDGHGGHDGGHTVYFSETSDEHGEGSSEAHGETHDKEAAHETSHETVVANEDAENMYRVLIGKYDNPIFVLEPEGKTKFLSSDFSENYGYELTEMEEGSFFSYIYPIDLADFMTEYTSVLQSGKAVNGVGPYRFVNKDGSVSVHMVSLLPVITDDGKVTEIIGHIKDITSKIEDFDDTIQENAVDGEAEEDVSSHDEHTDYTVDNPTDLLRKLLTANF